MHHRTHTRHKKNRKMGAKKTVNKKYGGGSTVMPMKYYNPNMVESSATAGNDLLKASLPISVRPRIGGMIRNKTQRRKLKGGFVPSIMEGFVAATSKYIVPIALFAGYKMITRKNKHKNKTK